MVLVAEAARFGFNLMCMIVSQDQRVWAIGIYSADSPVSLSPHQAAENPVLTRSDVTDIEAEFVADPFMVEKDGTWFMFFEALNKVTSRGEVGLAVSSDTLRWEYRKIVLKESFHLSYPYVFRDRDAYYMIPETLGLKYVALYKARAFPFHWEFAGRLLEGTHADPSIFRSGQRWWMFTCPAPYSYDILNLYFADDLTGLWYEHPRSPIVSGDAAASLP